MLNSQLSLPFPISERSRFQHFRVGGNAEVCHRLMHLGETAGFAGLWLSGAPASGKTHLLQALLHAQRQAHPTRRMAYLPLGSENSPDLLVGYDDLDLVVLDDVDAWIGPVALEEALVHLFTAMRQQQKYWVMASRTAPSGIVPTLPDLSSRLRSLDCYEIRPISDQDKVVVVQDLAFDRGLRISDRVMDYWLQHGQRDLANLLLELDQLYDRAVGDQREITVPFLKQVLGI